MDVIKDTCRKIPKNIWICFYAGVVFGVIIHLYMLTNKLPNWDDLYNLRGFGSGDDYGRWMLKYIRPLAGEWSVPAFNGMLAIILWSIASCFIYLAMEMKTTTAAILTPLMMLSFPSIASTMTYMFTVICYAIGILFVCMGVYLYRKYKYGFLPAIILFVLSMGIYQSFICLAIGMLIMGFVIDTFYKDRSFAKIFKNGIKSLISLGIAFPLYLFVCRSNSSYFSTDRGIDTMGQIEIQRLPRLIARSYKRILEYFVTKPYSFTTPFTQFVNTVITVLIVVLFLWIIWKKKVYKDKAKMALAMILMLIEPMAIASIYIMAPETQDATLMMLHQYFFVYIIAIVLMEQLCTLQMKGRMNQILVMITTISLLLIGYRYYLVTNEAYFRTSLAFDRAYAFYNRIVMNIESQEGFSYGDDISILGEYYPEPNPIAIPDYDADRYDEFYGIAMENGLLTTGVRRNFLNTYLGINCKEIFSEQNDRIISTKEYQDMPEYPAKGSIRKIEDIWIVKLKQENSGSDSK